VRAFRNASFAVVVALRRVAGAASKVVHDRADQQQEKYSDEDAYCSECKLPMREARFCIYHLLYVRNFR